MSRALHVVLWVGLWGCASTDPTGTSVGHDLATTPQADLAHVLSSDVDLATDLASAPADLATSGCDSSSTTLGATGGPDICAYGQLCDDTTSACVAASVGTCGMASGAPAWAQPAGPVITSITASLLATTGTTECANGDPAALVTVVYYTPTTLTTMDSANAFLAQVKFKKSTSATSSWFSANFVRSLPPKNSHFGSFQVGINCGGAAGSVKQAGLYIVDEAGNVSNTACTSW